MRDSRFYQAYYSGHAIQFDATRLWDGNEIGRTAQAVARRFERTQALVEIGCGSFAHGAYLASRGFKVIGIDFSIEQLRHAQQNAPLVCADVRSMPFRSQSVGGALGVMMLHQVPAEERGNVLNEIHRVLQPRKNLILKTCTHNDLRRRPLTEWFPSSLKINLERFPSDQQLTGLLADSGFELVERWSTESFSSFPKNALMTMFETRPSSSLRLVPEDEYFIGLEKFRNAHVNDSFVPLGHYHTFYNARST